MSEAGSAGVKYREWTTGEIAELRLLFAEVPSAVIGRRLGRSARAVQQRGRKLGLVHYRRTDPTAEAFVSSLRAKHAEHWTDAEFSAWWGCTRETVTRARKRLGLPSNQYGPRHRKHLGEATKRQCDEFGVKSLGQLRGVVVQRRAATSGWPVGLFPREVALLDALEAGAKTRRQLCDAIGLPWRGTRGSMKSNRPGGTHLAYLQRLGLVVKSWRYAITRQEAVYRLADGVKRRAVGNAWAEAA